MPGRTSTIRLLPAGSHMWDITSPKTSTDTAIRMRQLSTAEISVSIHGANCRASFSASGASTSRKLIAMITITAITTKPRLCARVTYQARVSVIR